jgi:hypothetical protein
LEKDVEKRIQSCRQFFDVLSGRLDWAELNNRSNESLVFEGTDLFGLMDPPEQTDAMNNEATEEKAAEPIATDPALEKNPVQESQVSPPEKTGFEYKWVALILIVLGAVAGFYSFSHFQQSSLQQSVEALAVDAQRFGITLPTSPLQDASVEAFKKEVMQQQEMFQQIEGMIPDAGRFGLKVPVTPYQEKDILAFTEEMEQQRQWFAQFEAQRSAADTLGISSPLPPYSEASIAKWMKELSVASNQKNKSKNKKKKERNKKSLQNDEWDSPSSKVSVAKLEEAKRAEKTDLKLPARSKVMGKFIVNTLPWGTFTIKGLPTSGLCTGKSDHSTPCRGKLPVGNYVIRLKSKDYPVHRATIKIKEGPLPTVICWDFLSEASCLSY